MRAAENMNFVEGVLWSEPGAGTNAIGTAIAADHAVQVFGPEHFNEPVQRWTCSAAPIHDPDTGELLGVIDLTGDYSTVHPHSLAVATATAQAVEASLRLELAGARRAPARPLRRPRRRARRAPRARWSRRPAAPITGLPPGWSAARTGLADPRPAAARCVLPSGAPAVAEPVCPALEAFVVHAVEPRARRAPPARCSSSACSAATARCCEIDGRRDRAAPAARRDPRAAVRAPHGMSAETLCADLHGDGGSSRSVRVEVVAPAQAARPVDRHRPLPAHVRRRDRRAPRRGPARRAARVREAAEAYPGPLLPSSEAPGRRARARAPGRLAAPGGDDRRRRRGAVGLGPRRPPARTTSPAWKRLLTLARVPRPAPRAVAARVGELRRAALM